MSKPHWCVAGLVVVLGLGACLDLEPAAPMPGERSSNADIAPSIGVQREAGPSERWPATSSRRRGSGGEMSCSGGTAVRDTRALTVKSMRICGAR